MDKRAAEKKAKAEAAAAEAAAAAADANAGEGEKENNGANSAAGGMFDLHFFLEFIFLQLPALSPPLFILKALLLPLLMVTKSSGTVGTSSSSSTSRVPLAPPADAPNECLPPPAKNICLPRSGTG